ncbi:MAG TPA: methyltransferase domain-containing protein [Halomicronema sp.]
MDQSINAEKLKELKEKYNLDAVRVDLGCGPFKPANYIGVDIHPALGVDIVADLTQSFPFPDNSIDELRAHDVIEHLPDRLQTMNEIWRVCKSGATVDILVPSTDGRGAFQDPTHVSFWNINSFLYYCIDFPGYYQLCQRYGFKGAFKVLTLEQQDSGNMVIHVVAKLLVVKGELQGNEKANNLSQVENILSRSLRENEQLKQASIEEYPLIVEKLRQTRKELAYQYLNIEPNQIKEHYLGELGKAHQLFVNHVLKIETLNPEEEKFIEELEAKLVNNQVKASYTLNYLLALMLYRHPHEFPVLVNLSDIPQWFFKDYLRFILQPPAYFQHIGEADNYCRYMHQCIDTLHTSIFNNKKSQSGQNLALAFLETANFIGLYFNEVNLREIYTKRAEIINEFMSGEIGESLAEFTAVSPHKKIRLGILAANFGSSAETFASLPVYEYLSRDFEVILYCFGKTGHTIEQYCQSCANTFKILPHNLGEAYSFIRNDDLDILYIATNITIVANPISILAAQRLARIQITSVASVVTTGMPHIDYFISGELTDPSPNAQEHYRETLLKVTGSAQCFSYGDKPDTVTFEVNRDQLAISQESIVFISGANFFKIIPELIETWAKIIHAVPQSILVLLPFGPHWAADYPKQAFIHHLHSKFAKYDVSPDRLMVLDPQPIPNRKDIKQFMKIADIYLDSFPFAGSTSLIEPLEVGLPMICQKGTYFRSAMGGAILEELGISELVTNSEDAYIELAVSLANNPNLRKQKKSEILQKMAEDSPFLNSRSYALKLEELFKKNLNDYQNNALKKEFRLNETNLILFPDWTQMEEVLSQQLTNVFKRLFQHPDKSKITLLIDTGHVLEETADMIVSSVVMSLLIEENIEENIDADSGLEISLIGELANTQWQALKPHIHARISLPNENSQSKAYFKLKNLPIFDI